METIALPAKIALTRRLVLANFYALLVYFALNSVLSLPELSLAMPVIWLLQTLPLLIFLPGLLRTRPRSFAWLSFVILLYFMHAVLLAFEPERRWLGVLEALLCTSLFTLLVIFIRQYRDHYQVGI
ncbi:MAG: DUF2069 domain-containing protein [Pseudohongiellaceae bacterium]